MEKLQVRMLPCVLMFVGGVAVDRIVGFEDLGAKDDFPTSKVGGVTGSRRHGLSVSEAIYSIRLKWWWTLLKDVCMAFWSLEERIFW